MWNLIRSWSILSAVSLVVVNLSACTTTRSDTVGDGLKTPRSDTVAHGLKVRVLLYSGRPDPVFVLQEGAIVKQAQALMNKARAVTFQGKTIIPSVLGYKGIVVENPRRVAGLPERFAVYKGVIEVMAKENLHYSDDGRGLEKFLLNEAVRQKAMDATVLTRLKVDEMN